MSSKNEKIYRLLYSAIAGSTLSVRDIRRLVEDLSANGELVRMLQAGLWRLCEDLDDKFGHLSKSEINSSNSDKYFVDLVIDRVNSRRISKAALRYLMDEVSGEAQSYIDPSRLTMRAMVEAFIDLAGPSKVSKLIDALDIGIEEDAYLGGIDKKSRGLL